MFMCGVVLCCCKRVFDVTSVFSWQTLLAFALLNFILQGQMCLLPQVSLDFLFLHSVPYDENDIFVCVCVLVLEGLVGLHRTV